MEHLYQSELQVLEWAMNSYIAAHVGGTYEDEKLLKKIQQMRVDEEDRNNRD